MSRAAAPATGLELRDISAGYAGAQVLRSVSLVAPAGHVTALIGGNGAGKTTLLNVASGLHRPTSGAVVLDGRDVTRCRPAERVQLGICHIPEGRAIFPSLTVRENLQLHDRDAVEDVVGTAIEAFPALGQRLDQVAGSMSGGQQQMLALARAYVSGPNYILLDEVSMGLAPALVAEIFEFLEKLARGGAGLLVVEQYVSKVLDIADVVYVLRKGQVVFAGAPDELDAEALAESYVGSSASRKA
ncbi:MAG: ABC transporter ATP-binding protein [Actinomycetota bacterium]|jgi:branched-chain amino acid transport system ATP-binding protein